MLCLVLFTPQPLNKGVIKDYRNDLYFILGGRFFLYTKEYEFNTYSYLLSSIVLSGFSLATIYIFVFEKTFKDPFHNFFFWTSIGILFCYLGNIPYLMFYNILFQKAILIAYSLTIISQIVNSILYIMIIIGILYHRRPSNEISKLNLDSFL